jgi:hypothetical protein
MFAKDDEEDKDIGLDKGADAVGSDQGRLVD